MSPKGYLSSHFSVALFILFYTKKRYIRTQNKQNDENNPFGGGTHHRQ